MMMDCAREALIDNRVIALCRAWGRGKPSVDALGVGARSNPRACIFSVITGAETPLAFDAGEPDTTPTDIGAGREGLGARSYFVTGVVRRSIFWIKERWVSSSPGANSIIWIASSSSGRRRHARAPMRPIRGLR